MLVHGYKLVNDEVNTYRHKSNSWLMASPSVSSKCCYIVYIAGGYSNSYLFINTQRPHQTMYTQANKYDGNELVSGIHFFYKYSD